MERKTKYINTDLVISSSKPIGDLCNEFDRTCCVLYQQQADDGNWNAAIESDTVENVYAADDIRKMLCVASKLSGIHKAQWDACHLREINIGFDCGDTWAYPHSIANEIVRMIADAKCTLAITLYPIRDEDQTKSSTGEQIRE